MDSNKDFFDGSRSYTVTLPPDIPQARFWSLTLYDNQTRSMLVTPQRYPRAGSQSYPSPAAVANADGSTTIHFGPEQPAGVADGNWIQTDARQGVLRRPPPLQPTAAVLRQVVARRRVRTQQRRSGHDRFAYSDRPRRAQLVLDALTCARASRSTAFFDKSWKPGEGRTDLTPCTMAMCSTATFGGWPAAPNAARALAFQARTVLAFGGVWADGAPVAGAITPANATPDTTRNRADRALSGSADGTVEGRCRWSMGSAASRCGPVENQHPVHTPDASRSPCAAGAV